MYMWTQPIRYRERIEPVSSIRPYVRILPNIEREPEQTAEDYLLYPDRIEPRKKELKKEQSAAQSPVEPILAEYARTAAMLVQAALEVADQAASLFSKEQFHDEELKSFLIAIHQLKAQMEGLEIEDPNMSVEDEDSAYLRSDRETIEYWDEKARYVLGISPLELINAELSYQSYASYNMDKQKTWGFPHQGLIMQTYA